MTKTASNASIAAVAAFTPLAAATAGTAHHLAVPIPPAFLAAGPDGPFGGDIRIGDFDGDGRVDFLVYRSVDDAHDGGGMKPYFVGAFDLEGRPLWSEGGGGILPSRPGPVALIDLDGDGRDEIICFFHDASGANWVHQRILVANQRGLERPRDFVIKLGARVVGSDNNLDVRWTYESPWTEYTRCPAYIPSVGDIDGDGRDEVNGGYFLLDDDGTVLWERFLGRNVDSVAIAEWDEGRARAIGSGFGHVMDEHGRVILALGEDLVPHGQELRLGRFDPAVPRA